MVASAAAVAAAGSELHTESGITIKKIYIVIDMAKR